jgi:hypothetical protein
MATLASDRRAGENPVVAVAAEASLEERVQRAVHGAVTAHRAELEQMIRGRLDRELDAIATALVAEQIAQANGTPAPETKPLCSQCGAEPRLPGRTIGRTCKHRQDWQRRKARRATAPASDDEEPEPAHQRKANGAAGGAGELLERAESRRKPPTGMSGCLEPEHVEEHTAGIAADELARRAGRSATAVRRLTGDELEAWLRDAGLAQVTGAGLLVPTDRAVEIAGALTS